MTATIDILADLKAVHDAHALGVAAAASGLPRDPASIPTVASVIDSAPEDLAPRLRDAYIAGHDKLTNR